ncbi:MAG: LLM class flavin-dependent oxidoreductase [Spirochaetaceae bacterium]|nr:LLM class flavin-dependent oxidoreductase [Spirochaetaceae bacterium]
MQFGHFSYHITRAGRSGDARAIEEALAEARLAEQLGYDAVWFSEHHFTGETVYADPIVFATAVAMQTRRVKLGFAVLEMALYHPVRVAEQLALLDNLSGGRVIVGIARGSAFNAYEYRGFGTSVQFGRECLDEAEELLVKCWTARDGMEFHGKYWDVVLPEVRPHPVQQPHPPVLRAAVGPPSVRQMAAQRRPVLMRSFSTDSARETVQLYRDGLYEAGCDAAEVRSLLAQCWIWRDCFVADSDTGARAEFLPRLTAWLEYVNGIRARWNPPDPDQEVRTPHMPLPAEAYGARPDPAAPELFVGSPERVAEQLSQLHELGVGRVMLTHYGALLEREQRERSMRLLAEQVFPLFQGAASAAPLPPAVADTAG